jgi:hypothetical protein
LGWAGRRVIYWDLGNEAAREGEKMGVSARAAFKKPAEDAASRTADCIASMEQTCAEDIGSTMTLVTGQAAIGAQRDLARENHVRSGIGTGNGYQSKAKKKRISL